jgi:hypothetical protein
MTFSAERGFSPALELSRIRAAVADTLPDCTGVVPVDPWAGAEPVRMSNRDLALVVATPTLALPTVGGAS